MTPREIIIRNLEFRQPDRIGYAFDGGRRNDFCMAWLGPSLNYSPRRWKEGNREFYDDEWGNIWVRIDGMSAGGEIHTPALKNWEDFDHLRWPDWDSPYRYEEIRKLFSASNDHYRLAFLPGFPFAICRYLRNMDVYFQDLVLERDNIDKLHDRVTSMLEGLIRNMAQAGADGIFFCEDWGIQDRMLIHPDMWREIFKPLYERLCRTAHQHNLHVLMHSCGYNWAILDDLAQVGVNAFQFDQPALYGLERLSKKLRELNVCLFSPVDIQKVLPTGNQELIQAQAKQMIRLFGGRDGGLIAKNYGDLPGIGVRQEWDQWAYLAFCASE